MEGTASAVERETYMSVVAGYDCIHNNIGRVPKGQLAGYTTGSRDIRWTDTDWRNHPGAVRIDQDFNASDPSADVLDVERGAATNAECARWVKQARNDFDTVVRRGQRHPAIYTSASNVTPVVNSLIAGGVTKGVGLFVASWGVGKTRAAEMVANASGPFPIVAVQYNNGLYYDFDVFSHAWLTNVSGNIAHNPVRNLHVVDRGFTHITLAWDGERNADNYSVRAYWRGNLVKRHVVTSPSIRFGFLRPGHTYTFLVRAHPGGSIGSPAEIKSTTRPAH
jgi:hypothetical protein